MFPSLRKGGGPCFSPLTKGGLGGSMLPPDEGGRGCLPPLRRGGWGGYAAQRQGWDQYQLEGDAAIPIATGQRSNTPP